MVCLLLSRAVLVQRSIRTAGWGFKSSTHFLSSLDTHLVSRCDYARRRFSSHLLVLGNTTDCSLFTNMTMDDLPPVDQVAGGDSKQKRGTEAGEEAAPSKRKKTVAKKNSHENAVVYDPVTMRKPKKKNCVSIVSWNVAGLRAFLKKASEDLETLVAEESPDIFCIQEHKLQEGKHGEDARAAFHKYFPECSHGYWNFSTVKKGYSGTAILSKKKPLRVTYGLTHEEHSENDEEGRIITAEFDSFYIVNTYVPNSGAGLKRLDFRVQEWDVALSNHVKALEEKEGKPVVLVGDMNCAAEEIDIHSPKTNLRSAGFTIEERESFAKRYLKNGLTDAFRTLHPGVIGYTYWGYRFNLRAKNKGWRLDYFLVSDGLFRSSVYDCYHLPSFMGSDHAPLGISVEIDA